VQLVDAYCKAQNLFHETGARPEYSLIVELNLSTVEPSLTGPRRPQDRVTLSAVKRSFLDALGTLGAGYGMQDRDLVATFPASDPPKSMAPGARPPADEPGPTPKSSEVPLPAAANGVTIRLDGDTTELNHGSVVIAAIELHEHVQSGGDDRRRSDGQEGSGARFPAPAGGEIEPRAGTEAVLTTTIGQASPRIWTRSGSPQWATAARLASATPARCPNRSRQRSNKADWSSARCCPGTGTSRPASIRTGRRTISPSRPS
jgi:hypothetical protein